jgi:class 3 adenylate cyclase
VRRVARLGTAQRAQLPDSAFAYIDGRGRRRLPIHDEAHVRNALARFNQVVFDDAAARDRARTRLLNAAKRFRIVPVGFITGQLRSERDLGEAQARQPLDLPTGFLTMLMTDVEESTALVHRFGPRYHDIIGEVRTLLQHAVTRHAGHAVEARADEFFGVFEAAGSALAAAVDAQRELRACTWPDGVAVRVRIGLHSGQPTLSPPNYIGMAVHTTARICASAHGEQILASGATRAATDGATSLGVRFRSLGEHHLRGVPGTVPLYQVLAKDLRAKFPALRNS